MEECKYDYSEAQERVKQYCVEAREKVNASDAKEETKALALEEIDKIEEEAKLLVPTESVKVAVEEAAAKRHFSTNLVPFGAPFRMAKSGTRYVRTRQGLRRVDAEGNIISRKARRGSKEMARKRG